MRIAVISTPAIASWGGSEELWAAMVEEALDAGHSVAISPRLDQYHPPDRLRALEQKGALILNKPVPAGDSKSLPLELDERAHYRQLFTPAPDVVFINNGGGYEGLFSRSMTDALEELSAPYVVACRLVYEAGFISEDERARATKFFSRARHVVYPARRNHVAAQRHIANSLPGGVVLHSPVNLSDFSFVDWPASETVLMSGVARLEPVQKGQDILFEALQSSLWMSRDWKLRLYGSGMRQPFLEKLVQYYGIAERVEFAGFVKDVRSIWTQSHLFVLPSRDEGTPIALMEAMLCGRPCVVTDVGGNAEWVENGVTGFVAAAPTVKLFENALERAWRAREDWPQMGRRAQQRALARYDKNPGGSLLKLLLGCVQKI
jgi:L-malate glycosyltransferase